MKSCPSGLHSECSAQYYVETKDDDGVDYGWPCSVCVLGVVENVCMLFDEDHELPKAAVQTLLNAL